MSKSILQAYQKYSVQKIARKNTKYSRNETILKIGHLAKAVAFAWAIYSLCKILNLGQKFKLPKTCQNRFCKFIRSILCKKPLGKEQIISPPERHRKRKQFVCMGVATATMVADMGMVIATPWVGVSTLFVALFRVTMGCLLQSCFPLKFRSFFSYRKTVKWFFGNDFLGFSMQNVRSKMNACRLTMPKILPIYMFWPQQILSSI